MNKKIIVIVLAALMLSVSLGFAATAFKVNNRDMQEGDSITLSKDDLDGNRMVFSLPAPDGVSSAEISLDNGRQWNEMKREGPLFVYAHRPMGDEQIRVVFLFKNGGGKMSTRATNTTILYQKNRPDDAVKLVLEKMKDAYEAENKSRFMDLFSMRYPDRIKFEESIQNDFYNYNNIRLFYRIDRATFTPDYKGAIWDIYWERKYMDRTGNNFSDSANITMNFVKEGDTWVINGMRNNTIFGSSLLSSPELVITSSDMTSGYGPGGDYILTAVIHNTGAAAANNFKVAFYYPTASTLNGTETVSTINANSPLVVKHSIGFIVPPPTFTVRVVIDPERVVPEDNRNNNEATKTF